MLNNTTKDKCGLKLDRSFISIFPAPTIRCIKGHIDLSEYTGNFGKLVNHPVFQKSQCTMNETNDRHVLMYFTGVTLTPAHETGLVMMQLFRDDYSNAAKQVAKLETLYKANEEANNEMHENIADKVKRFVENTIPESTWEGYNEEQQIPVPTDAMHVFIKKEWRTTSSMTLAQVFP